MQHNNAYIVVCTPAGDLHQTNVTNHPNSRDQYIIMNVDLPITFNHHGSEGKPGFLNVAAYCWTMGPGDCDKKTGLESIRVKEISLPPFF